MKKFIFWLILLAMAIATIVLILAVWQSSADGSFAISGYAPKQFTLDDDKISQILAGMELIEGDLFKGGKALKVLVIGSADQTGQSIDNGSLSKNRAEPVAALLRDLLFIEAIIGVVPKGDTENARVVRVEWKYVPVAQTSNIASKDESNSRKTLGWMALGILFLAFALAIRMLVGANRRFKAIKSKSAEEKVITIKVSGKDCSTKIKFKDGFWKLPFKNVEGCHPVEQRKEIELARKAFKTFMAEVGYAAQREEAIKTGKVWFR